MPGQILPALIGGAGGLFGGLMGGPSQKSTTAPNWLPGQQDLMQQLFAQYLNALKLGTGVQASDRNALMTQINNSYAGMKPALTADLTSRGFGSSGNMGRGFEGVDTARANAQEQGFAGLQNQAMQRWLSLIGMGPSMGQPFGGTTTTGTQQQGLGQTIGGAIAPLGAALAVNNPFAPSTSAAATAPPNITPMSSSDLPYTPPYDLPSGGINVPSPGVAPPPGGYGSYSPPVPSPSTNPYVPQFG